MPNRLSPILALLVSIVVCACQSLTGVDKPVSLRIADDIKYTFVTVGPGSSNAPDNQCALVTLTSDIKLQGAASTDQYGVLLDDSVQVYSYYSAGDPSTQPYFNQIFFGQAIRVFRDNPVVVQVQGDPSYLKNSSYTSRFDFKVTQAQIVAEDPTNAKSYGVGSSFDAQGLGQPLPCNAVYSLHMEAEYFDDVTNPAAHSLVPVSVERFSFAHHEDYVAALRKLRSLDINEMVRLYGHARALTPFSEADTQDMASNLGIDPRLAGLWVRSMNRTIEGARLARR